MKHWYAQIPATLGRKNVWILILALTTIFAFALNIYGLTKGISNLTPHLFYLPIVIAAYWFPRKGVIFSVAVGMSYLALVYLFTYPDIDSITSATARFYVLVAIGVIVASLSNNLKEQEDRYHGIFDNSEAGIFLLRRYPENDVIDEVNQRGADLLGYRMGGLLGRPIREIWNDDSEYGVFRERLAGRPVTDWETTLRKKTGEKIRALVSAGMLEDGMIVFTAVDISARTAAEEALKESKERYQGLYNNALVGLVRTRIKDGKVLEANEQMARMFLYPDVQAFIDEFVFNERYADQGTRDRLIEDLLVRGSVSNFEARFIRRDGSFIWARYWASIFLERGYIEAVFTDITEEKLSHKALGETEERYRRLMDNLPDYVIVHTEGMILFANPSAAKVMGKTPEQLVGTPIGDYMPDASYRRIEENSRIRSSGEVVDPYEIELSVPGGAPRHVIVNATPIHYRDQYAMLAVLTDITERQLAEDELQASRDQYRITIDAMSDGIYLVDAGMRIILINPTFRRWMENLGLDEDLVGKRLPEAIPYLKPDICREFSQVISEGRMLESLDEFEHRGRHFSFETRKIPVMEDGEVVRVVTIMRDITRQRHIETEKRLAYEQIEKNIEQFAILGDHIRNPMQVILGIADLEGGAIFDRIMQQTQEIDRTITQLDKGWIESEKIREFVRKYYGIGK
ncbi:PAS domain S-box-containing protein [Methanolinea mesophila]|uniref:PAS domain S-box protein n=1 Tax=Methanolinea mesophila TaxID=547055 RepID=UPI001AEB70E9|nr:PAS domain S-box protein [Methanolinea mesophila]MBP1929231.1 PAS domain S-box-containing protein [Methanolinea mesophila]